MKLRPWAWFVLAVIVVIAVLAIRGRVVIPPKPPKPAGEFVPVWPGPKLSEEEYLASLAKSFEPVIYGIVEDPVAAQERLDHLWPIITKAAQKYGLDPYLLRGIFYLESQGKVDLVSGASCAGVAQFAPSTARGFGLLVSKNWRSLYNAYQGEKNPARKAKKWAKLQRLDERFDPAKAIPAAAHYLGCGLEEYGGADYAVAAYHMGGPNLRTALRAYRAGWKAPDHFTWFELIMDAAPNRHPRTFAFLHDRLEDGSWTYYFRVLAAREACWLWSHDDFNHTTYLIKAMFYDKMAKKGRRPRLAHEFLWYEDKMKEYPPLVKLTGSHTNVIVDPQVSHPELTPEMAGLLYYLATQVREAGGKSIRITSAYRTFRQQGSFSSHRYASGMDLGIKGLKPLTLDLLEWNLMKLRARGVIIYYQEKYPPHYHVTINPKADYFAKVTKDLDKYLAESRAHSEWAKKWGQVKPVGFWEGFWGRLFSWPWLLVLAIGIYLSVLYEQRVPRIIGHD